MSYNEGSVPTEGIDYGDTMVVYCQQDEFRAVM